MGKMMNLRLNTINWKVLAEASEKLEGELASQPILGLVRAEVTLRGVEALERERRGYREYILLRSLGLKAWFTMATSRAGVKDPRMRCAVGAALAKPDGEFNIYRRVFAHCRAVAENEDWNAFADGLAGDVRRVVETVAEADLKTTKVRYDAKVTEEDFDRIEAEVNGAIEALEAIKNEGVKGGEEEARAIAVTVPWVDPGAPPPGVLPSSEAGGSEEGASSSEEGASSEDASAAESMFGKRSKKKKAKMPKAGGGVVAGASALASALRSGESLEATLARLAKRQAEPTFPDVARWTVGDAKQATASEAVAALAAVALGAPEGSTVVAPSAISPPRSRRLGDVRAREARRLAGTRRGRRVFGRVFFFFGGIAGLRGGEPRGVPRVRSRGGPGGRRGEDEEGDGEREGGGGRPGERDGAIGTEGVKARARRRGRRGRAVGR